MITRDMIKNGFENGTISIEENWNFYKQGNAYSIGAD